MELSPEEYGAYWRASIYVAAGILLVALSYRFVIVDLFGFGNAGALIMGLVLFGAIVFAGTFLVILGLARLVRTAIDAEMRG
ncbi:hypothetical protein D8Y22_12185 [Salinadaptatus halalkaliphilus]|uniref:Uncharacterized protein n=1 Tax=Salinadaptatus halalkaliphilus TaxID=2419781 RepID=A0A4S3TKC2_9EURY|nr:hypothetical protein [Salinadaptatus halalkaliphilus]THE64579.1 hypothetical protein D8Y22_12185 [Salinadaptatus halalkaliphilus]